jgi:hypothetical protein
MGSYLIYYFSIMLYNTYQDWKLPCAVLDSTATAWSELLAIHQDCFPLQGAQQVLGNEHLLEVQHNSALQLVKDLQAWLPI